MRVRKHANPLNFIKDKEKIQLQKVFDRPKNPLTFEIGFAYGEYLLDRASKEPSTNFIGIEVRGPLVEKVSEIAKEKNLDNIYVMHASSAVNLDIMPDNSVDEVITFFCDPCFKNKHHKRRIVSPDFLKEIKPKLKAKHSLFFQTDVEDLYKATIGYIEDNKDYKITNTEIVTGVPNKTGSVSYFEQRCIDNDWEIYRIEYQLK